MSMKLSMPTSRREFLGELTGLAIAVAAPLRVAQSAGNAVPLALPHIKSFSRRDETLLRLGGDGCTFGLTWTSDGRILAAMFEGGGWAGTLPGLYFTSALMSIKGEPNTALIEAVPGYPIQPVREFFKVNGSPKYSGCGTLAVGGRIYQFLGTHSGQLKLIDGNWAYTGPQACKLIYSPDNGRTWFNQDGTTPVRRERAEEQSRKTMIFWDEPGNVFQFPTLLQMGKGYEDNRDGYVYGYSGRGDPNFNSYSGPADPNSNDDNDLVMFRVRKDRVLDRLAYEFFAEGLSNTDARWTRDIARLSAVHRFPKDWVCSSVVYYEPLGIYLMAASRERYVDTKETIAWSGPAALGFWTSPTPWGPWTQVYEDDSWAPGHPGEGGCRGATIVPKWIAPDGRSFWLVWTDMYHKTNFRMDYIKDLFYTTDTEKFNQGMEQYREFMPYYRFNVQRVDLEVS